MKRENKRFKILKLESEMMLAKARRIADELWILHNPAPKGDVYHLEPGQISDMESEHAKIMDSVEANLKKMKQDFIGGPLAISVDVSYLKFILISCKNVVICGGDTVEVSLPTSLEWSECAQWVFIHDCRGAVSGKHANGIMAIFNIENIVNMIKSRYADTYNEWSKEHGEFYSWSVLCDEL